MRNYMVLLLLLSTSFISQTQTPEEIVEASLATYNRQDIEGFMSYFSEDITLYDFNSGQLRAQGTEQIRNIFEELFKESPKLHSTIVNRLSFDNKVIDHESVTGARGNKTAFEVTMIYEIKDQKIFKMTSIQKTR
ncbi:MAG: nuclear transport factor 2 family protein [Flavobacteriales bacterium]|nr:nuclear transport factor 2 family protein [Flavobacteriales bacterium]